MNIEQQLIDVKKYLKEVEECPDTLTNIQQKITNKENLITNFDNLLKEKVKKAILNTLKVNSDKYKDFDLKNYSDFFQVRDNETKQLKFTYSFSKWDGLGIRRYCDRHTKEMNIKDIREFTANKKAVNKFSEILQNEELINCIVTIMERIENLPEISLYKNDDYSNPVINYIYHISPTENEKKLGIDTSTIDFNIRNDTLGIGQHSDLDSIIEFVIINNHEIELMNFCNEKIKELDNLTKVYQDEIDFVNNTLARYLMLELL